MAKQVKLDLSVFKASGVYTLEFDASENIIINPQTVRLVVGYSNIGPFNTPVYCPDVSTFQTVFGDIDRTSEKKGSFFHRSALTCLQSGPIFAISLRLLNNTLDVNGDPDYAAGADVARYRAFSVDTEEKNGSGYKTGYSDPLTKQDKLLSSYYNKEKFWFPDTNYFVATQDNSGSRPDKQKLLSFVNLGENKMSLIVRKSLDSRIPLKGFDITAREYFGAANVPSYMNPYDYISDWFIDVIAVTGNWTDYQALSNDPLYSAYFTSKGFIKSKIDDFLSLNSVNIVLTATGCLIPGFLDQNGSLRYIQTLINNQVQTTGLLCSVNEDALDNIENNTSVIDLVGHHLVDESSIDSDIPNPKELDFLSYSQALTADFQYFKNIDGSTTGTELEDGNSPSWILPETGTLLDDSVLSTTGSGIEETDFEIFSSASTSRDGGQIYLQTKFINSTTHDSQLELLWNFVNPTVSEPVERWVLGKVTSLPAGLSTYQGFVLGDLVKLKVTEIKYVTNGSLSTAVKKQIRLKLSHPLVGSGASNTYVEPWADTNKNSTNSYQFGKADYFDRDDVYSPGTGIESYYAYEASAAYQDYKKGNIGDADNLWLDDNGTSLSYIKFEKVIDRDGFNALTIRTYQDIALTQLTASLPNWDSTYVSSLPVGTNLTQGTSLNIVATSGNLYDYISINSQLLPNVIEISESIALSTGIKVGNLLVSTDTQTYDNPATENLQSRLTRVLEVKTVKSSASPGTNVVQVKTERPVKLYPGTTTRVLKFKTIQEFVRTFNFTYLPGTAIKDASKPNGTEARLNAILDVMYNTNIARTLADVDIITFRYIIDTFDGGVGPNSKYQLTKLAKLRQKCMAICNTPSMKKFYESTDPIFTDKPTAMDPAPILQARYIADGGNLSLNPSFTYSLPDEDLGAKFSGFFGPFLTIRENGKNLNVPPAAYVSNNFIRKFVTGEPYSIVAGVKRGILSAGNLIGLEYDFDIQDREYLEPFGINPIIRKKGVGIVIYGNQTGYQRTNSAFNNLHVRDLLITIETGIEEILGNYVFDFNEDSVRLEIKTLVDNYLTGVRAVGGIYNYLSIMDSSNNTPAIIDQNLGIIDVIIEPARGIHKFINRMTVTRTGGISSGGFIQFT